MISRRDAGVVVGLAVLSAIPILAGAWPMDALLPGEAAVRSAFAAGQPPLWNPFAFVGEPLLANPVHAVFYPPLFLTRLAPIAWTVFLLAIVHAALFTVGVYFVIREVGETRVVGVLAAAAALAAVTLLPPFASGWPTLPAVAWLPVLIAATLASTRGRRLSWAVMVFALSAVLLAGSLRGVLYAVAAVVGAAAFAAVWPEQPTHRLALLRRCGLALILAIALTACQTFPQIEFASQLAAGEFVTSVPNRDGQLMVPSPDRSWESLLPPLRGHAAVSTCDRVRSWDMTKAGIRVPEPWGLQLPRVARFTSLTTGRYPVPDDPVPGLEHAAEPAARTDLLAWLGLEYVIACDTPNLARWVPTQTAGEVAVYRSQTPPLSAVWTCAPRAVSNDELEYVLMAHRFNGVQAAGRRFVVHVRWSGQASESDRLTAERALGLLPLRFMEQRTWQYELSDAAADSVRAVVMHPFVEDTAQINRHRFEPEPLPAPASSRQEKSEWLVGDRSCPLARPMGGARQRPYRGRTVIEISAPGDDGVLVLPRPYVPGLKAWVDGGRAPLLRVNLVLVAIPVTAGPHRVEVSYLPDGQVYGAAVSGVAWFGCAVTWWISRRRR